MSQALARLNFFGNYKTIVLSILTIFLALLVSGEAIADPINAPNHRQSIELTPALEIYIDSSGQRTIDEISSSDFATNFHKIIANPHALGLVKEPIWLKFTMTQAEGDRSTKIVELLYSYVDFLDLYRPLPAGGFERSRAGDQAPKKSRELPDRLMLLPIHQPAGSTQTYFLRYQDSLPPKLSFRLWDQEGLWYERLTEQFLFGMFYGAVLLLMIYSLAIFIASRVRVYLAYAGYILTLIVYMVTHNGLLQYFLLLHDGVIIKSSYLGTIGLLSFGGLFLLTEFLDTQTHTPKLHRLIQILKVVSLLVIPAIALLGWGWGTNILAVSVGGIASTCVFGTSIYFALVLKSLAGRYLLAAFLLPYFGSMLMVARALNLIEVSLFSEYGMQFGSFVEMIVLAFGLSEQIAQLSIDKDNAKAATLAKSEFLANMSHELRTPLNAILGFTQLMIGEYNLAPEQQERLEIVNRSGEHLLTLINSVLEMSKIESGQIRLNSSDFDFYDLLNSLQGMLILQAQAKGLGFIIERSLQTPRYIHCDGVKLRQVLINTLGNAIKFTKVGSVALVVDCEEIIDGLRLKFRVTDTGFGIAPNEIADIFDSFKQSESGRKAMEGTGLGLAISRKFLQMMGGDIQVQSKLGIGTTVTFDLVAQISAESFYSIPVFAKSVNLLDSKEVKILLAEDNLVNQKVAIQMLKRLGYQADIVSNGLEVLKAIAQKSYDLILMDLQMPEMDGLETTQQIRLQERELNLVPLKIIAMTANAMKEDRDRCLASGMNDHLGKPILIRDLKDCLESWIDPAVIQTAINVPR
jgi:signal transduction histidine kinase/CheY-like chemotaxis protein